MNLDDPAVRSICVAVNGEALAPYVPPQQAAAPKKEEVSGVLLLCVCLVIG